MTITIKPKYDFEGLDISKIDPEKLDLGTSLQDCSLIASTFERGAHHTPTEAAVFATFTRNLQNQKRFALSVSDSLATYTMSPAESASSSLEQAQSLGIDNGGAAGGTEHTLQSLNIGTQQQATYNDKSFGEQLLQWSRDCIPCLDRPTISLELTPNLDLLKNLESHLTDMLKFLQGLGDLLKNFDSFGDFCSLMNSLSFMCVPDLQRIIAMLMAIFTLDAMKLDSAIGIIQSLIGPLFAPLLMAITSLLEQFAALVTRPLQCVLDLITSQLSRRHSDMPYLTGEQANKNLQKVDTGLVQLQKQLREGIALIEEKLNFYIKQAKLLMGEFSGGDAAYLQLKLRSLQIVRMISFISAIISALAKGHAACNQSGEPPETSELNSFFQNFLNPQSSFDMTVDAQGQIVITDKGVLPPGENVIQFEGEPLLTVPTVESVQTSLTEPIRVVLPCKLENSINNATKVNQWIQELNKL
jgi:hypothetical protein